MRSLDATCFVKPVIAARPAAGGLTAPGDPADQDRLDAFAAHHRAQAPARARRNGWSLASVTAMPAAPSCASPPGPMLTTTYSRAEIAAQGRGRRLVAQPPIGPAVGQPRAGFIQDQHGGLAGRPAALQDERPIAERGQAVGGHPAGVRLLDAARQRAFAADREPAARRDAHPGQRPGRERQDVARPQRIGVRVDELGHQLRGQQPSAGQRVGQRPDGRLAGGQVKYQDAG